MRICLTTEHYPPHIGGVEIVFQEYAKRLAKRGHTVRVITSNSGGITGKRTVAKNIDVYYIACSAFFNHPLFPQKELAHHIAWADIVHTTTFTAALPSVALAKKYRKPCILTTHEVLAQRWFIVEKNPLKALAFYLFERYVISRDYTLWHAISNATRQDLIRCNIPKDRVITVYHGIDYTLWHKDIAPRTLATLFAIPPSKKIFLYNGRPGQTKGLFVLLDAIRQIHHHISKDFSFGFIISATPEKERAKFLVLIDRYHLSEIIHVADALPYSELPAYRKDAFALIVPSITEGFGFVAAETAALDVPLIVSDAGSLPEVVSGRVLFFKNSDATDLGQKILSATKQRFRTVPEKRFYWDDAIDTLEQTYINLIKTHP